MNIKDTKQVIDGMISNSINTFNTEPPVNELEIKPSFDIDVKEFQRKANAKARKMIKRSISHIFSEDISLSDEFIRSKIEMDVLTLGGIVYQLEVNQFIQEQAIKEIQNGASSPRMFEALTDITRTIAEINKQVILTLENLKRSYKEVKMEMSERIDPQNLISAQRKQIDNSITVYNGRDMIEQLNKDNKKDQIEFFEKPDDTNEE